MANSTVSNLTAASALDGTELYYGVQGGADRKVTGAQLRTLAGGIYTVTKTITSAEILNSASVSVEVIPAPGMGKAILLIGCISSLGGSINYTVPFAMILIYGATYSGALTAISDDFSRFAGEVQFTSRFGSSTLVRDEKSKFENQSICFSGGSINPTTGDGDILLTLTYIVSDV